MELNNDRSQNNKSNQLNNNSNSNRSGKEKKTAMYAETSDNDSKQSLNIKDEVDANDIKKAQNINAEGGSFAVANDIDKKKTKQADISDVLTIKSEKKEEIISTNTSTKEPIGDSGKGAVLPKDIKKDTPIEEDKSKDNLQVNNKNNNIPVLQKEEPNSLVSATKELIEKEKVVTPKIKAAVAGTIVKPEDNSLNDVEKKGEQNTDENPEDAKEDGPTKEEKLIERILGEQEAKHKEAEPKKKLDVAEVTTDQGKDAKKGTKKSTGKESTDKVESDVVVEEKQAVTIDAAKTEESSEENKKEGNESKETVKEEKSLEEKGKEEGEMVGRGVGYGMKIELDEAKTERDGNDNIIKAVYKKIPFEALYPQDNEGKEVLNAKNKFIAESYAAAEEQGADYLFGYTGGYNTGYAQGERYKKEEAEKKAKAEREEQANTPEYRLGLEVGKLAAMLSVQTNGAGATVFELNTQGENSVQYKTDLATVRKNKDLGLDPAGTPIEVGKEELYKDGFIVGYNMAYQEAFTTKNKQPTHQEKLAEPNFRKGYEEGNKLGRGQNLSPEEKERLEGIKKAHFSDAAAAKEKADPAYAKERGAFIYGYNSAYYQLQAEAKAKAKALKEKREKDPVYQLGKTAGTIKGILASIFGDAGFRPILKNNQVDVLKENGISFAIPPMISTIILEEEIPEDHELLANPEIEKDPEKKKALESKKAEQLGFFRVSYTRSFLEGYQKGQQDKASFAQNKERNNPDYERAMVVIYNGTEGPEGSEIALNLNPGGLVAYASYKLKYIDANDPVRGELEKGIAAEKAKAEKETDGYKLGFNQSYNYFASRLTNPKDKIYLAITGRKALEDYQGKTAEEKAYYNTGTILAAKKLEKQNELKEKKSKGENITAAQALLDKIFYASKVAVKSEIANELNESPAKGEPKPVFGESKTMEDLDAQLAEKLTAEALEQVKLAFQFFNNGYNAVMLAAFKNKDKSDKGNNKRELEQKFDNYKNKFKNASKSNKLISGLDLPSGIEISEGNVQSALEKGTKVKELHEKAAEEGYTTAYKASIKLSGKGSSREPVGAKNNYNKSVFQKRIVSKRLELINENKNLKDGEKGKINPNEFEEVANGLLYFFIKGFNYRENIDKNLASYGFARGVLHGENFVQGYKNEKFKEGSKTAYEQGERMALGQKSYASFEEGMGASKDDDKEGSKAEGKSDDSYKVGKKEAQKAWHKVVLYMEKQEIPENYGNDVQIKILEEEMNTPKSLEINVDNASEHWANRFKYAELSAQYYGKLKLWDKNYQVAKKNLESKNIQTTEKNLFQEYKKIIQPFLTSYKKGYLDSIDAIKKDTSSNINNELFYACGFRDGFIRVRGTENLPKELQAIDAKKEELDSENKHEIAIDKTHKEYLTGEAKGAEIGFKVNTGLLTEDKLGDEITKHNETQKAKEKKIDNLNEESDELDESDEEVSEIKKTTYQQLRKNDYVLGKENGEIAGVEAAKSENYNAQKPVPTNYADTKKKDIDAEDVSTKSVDDDKTKKEALTPLFIEGFYDSYWKHRDAKAGEIEGIKAVLYELDAYDIAAYYVLINKDDEKVEGEKRAVKHKDIFENSFINAREAARVHENPSELLEEVSKLEPKKNENQTEEEILKEEIKEAIKAAHEAARTAAEKIAQQYTYVKVALEMGVADRLSKISEISEIIKRKGFTTEEEEANKQKAAEEKIQKEAEEKQRQEKGEVELNKGVEWSKKTEEERDALKAERAAEEEEKKKVAEEEEKRNKNAAFKLSQAKQLMASYKTVTPKLTDENGNIIPLTEEWLEEVERKFIVKPDKAAIDEKIIIERDEIVKHFKGSDDEIVVKVEDWNQDLESGSKEEIAKNAKTTETTEENLKEKELEKQKKFSYHYLVPEEEKTLIRGELVTAFSEKHPAFYSKAVMDYTDLLIFDKMGMTKDLDEKEKKDEKNIIKGSLADIMDTVMSTITDGSNITFADLPILGVLREQEQKLKDAHENIKREQGKMFSSLYEISELKNSLLNSQKKTGSRVDLEKQIASLDIETESNEIEKLQQDLDAILVLEEKIKSIDLVNDKLSDNIERNVDDIRYFMDDNLKLSLPRLTNENILDYIDYFDKKLIVEGPFSYNTTAFKMFKQGRLTVHENAEDVRIDAAITVKKQDYEFKATGFEYIENKDSISLFSGTAVIPRLEANSSTKELEEYKFEELGFELKEALRSQLKLQRNKLEAGPIHKSTGKRNLDSNKKNLDKDADQHVDRGD